MASDEQQSAPQLASQAPEQQAADAIASLTLEEREGSAAEPPAPPSGRHAGYVRWFNASKGYGFICEGGKEALEGASGEAPQDLFVHQSSIRAEGFRSLREGEVVEFDVEPGEDGRNKAINVSGPGGAAPLGAPKRPAAPQRRLPIQHQPQHLQQPPSPHMLQPGQQQQIQQYAGGYGGFPGSGSYPPAAGMYSGGYPGAGPASMYPGSGGGYPGSGGGYPGSGGGYPGSGGGSGYQANPSMGMFQPPRGLPPHMRPPMGIPGGFPGQLPGGRGRGGGVADRRPPPGTPGVSSGLQVVVHNLPWTCSWQQLKDAFVEAGVANIERADVIIDSSGRSRGFGTVSFPSPQDAAAAVQNMNNADIGGRAVTVRIDRFA